MASYSFPEHEAKDIIVMMKDLVQDFDICESDFAQPKVQAIISRFYFLYFLILRRVGSSTSKTELNEKKMK